MDKTVTYSVIVCEWVPLVKILFAFPSLFFHPVSAILDGTLDLDEVDAMDSESLQASF